METETSGEVPLCVATIFGCCPDGIVPAQGTEGEGCDDDESFIPAHLDDVALTDVAGSGVEYTVSIPSLFNKSDASANDSDESLPIGGNVVEEEIGRDSENYRTTETILDSSNLPDEMFDHSTTASHFHDFSLTIANPSSTSDLPTKWHGSVMEASGLSASPSCLDTLYGCCPDGKTPSPGPDEKSSCPDSNSIEATQGSVPALLFIS